MGVLLLHEEAEMENLDGAVAWDSVEEQMYICLRLLASELIHFILFYWLTLDTVQFVVHAVIMKEFLPIWLLENK